MRTIDLAIPESEFARLNALYPPTIKSSTVGRRAIELVQFHFRTQDPACKFLEPGNGIDLEVTRGEQVDRIEVKGTADRNIAWMKLKVSGKPCYAHLIAGIELYRVVAVYERDPR